MKNKVVTPNTGDRLTSMCVNEINRNKKSLGLQTGKETVSNDEQTIDSADNLED